MGLLFYAPPLNVGSPESPFLCASILVGRLSRGTLVHSHFTRRTLKYVLAFNTLKITH